MSVYLRSNLIASVFLLSAFLPSAFAFALNVS